MRISKEPSRLLSSLNEDSEVRFKPIQKLKKHQLQHWAKCIKKKCSEVDQIKDEGLIKELIAGTIQGVKVHYKMIPRYTQILTVCLLLNPMKD